MDMESQVWKSLDYDARFQAATDSLPDTFADSESDVDPDDIGSQTNSKESDSESKTMQHQRQSSPDTPEYSGNSSGSSDEDEFVVISAPDVNIASTVAGTSRSTFSSYFNALYSSTNSLRRGVMSSHAKALNRNFPRVSSSSSSKKRHPVRLASQSRASVKPLPVVSSSSGQPPTLTGNKYHSFSGHSKVMLVAEEQEGSEAGTSKGRNPANVPSWRIPIPKMRIVILAVGTRLVVTPTISCL